MYLLKIQHTLYIRCGGEIKCRNRYNIYLSKKVVFHANNSELACSMRSLIGGYETSNKANIVSMHRNYEISLRRCTKEQTYFHATQKESL